MDWELASKELSKKLDPALVKSRQQSGQSLSYVEAWHCIAEANRIFGYNGWNRRTVYCREVSRTETTIGAAKAPGWKVGYEAMVRITVGDVIREGTGHGSGIAKDLFDCIEGAAKEAESDAMKRALMTFGNPFGLALYDKSRAMVGVEESPEDIAKREAEIAEDKRRKAENWVNSHISLVLDATTKEELERFKSAPQRERIRASYPDWYALIVEKENEKSIQLGKV